MAGKWEGSSALPLQRAVAMVESRTPIGLAMFLLCFGMMLFFFGMFLLFFGMVLYMVFFYLNGVPVATVLEIPYHNDDIIQSLFIIITKYIILIYKYILIYFCCFYFYEWDGMFFFVVFCCFLLFLFFLFFIKSIISVKFEQIELKLTLKIYFFLYTSHFFLKKREREGLLKKKLFPGKKKFFNKKKISNFLFFMASMADD